MRNLTTGLCFLFFLLAAHSSIGATKDITVTWDPPNSGDVLGYKMYYSYTDTMTDKVLACETNDASVRSLTCTDVELAQSPVYVAISAILPSGELTSAVQSQTFVAGIAIVQDFKLEITTESTPPSVSEYKLTWSLSADSIETPNNKTANRSGNGTYISAGCYDGNCYDNVDTSSYLTIPVINNDIIDPNNFEISLHFNPQSLANYHYIFSIVADNNNAHKVHVYENGSVYCRTVINGTQYYGYLDIPRITTGTWYKLTYSFTSNQIKISLNDTLVKTITTSDTFQGQVSEVRLLDSTTDGYPLNSLLDNITIK